MRSARLCSLFIIWTALLLQSVLSFRSSWLRSGQVCSRSSSCSQLPCLRSPEPYPDYVDISPNHDRGILKKVLQAGSGKRGYPSSHDQVEISWKMYSENMSLLYDSTAYEKISKRFLAFNLAYNSSAVLPGWRHAVRSMFEGERSLVVLSPQYAFAQHKPMPRKCTANMTIVCELLLRHILPGHRPKSEQEMAEEEQELVDKIQRGEISIDPPERAPVRVFDPSKHTVDPTMAIGGMGIGHNWEEKRNSMDITVRLPLQAVTKEDLQVNITAWYVSVHCKGQLVIAGPLHGKVLPSQSSWALVDGFHAVDSPGPTVQLSLEKSHLHADYWGTVFDRKFLETASPTGRAETEVDRLMYETEDWREQDA